MLACGQRSRSWCELASGMIRDAFEHISSSLARPIELHLSCVRMWW